MVTAMLPASRGYSCTIFWLEEILSKTVVLKNFLIIHYNIISIVFNFFWGEEEDDSWPPVSCGFPPLSSPCIFGTPAAVSRSWQEGVRPSCHHPPSAPPPPGSGVSWSLPPQWLSESHVELEVTPMSPYLHSPHWTWLTWSQTCSRHLLLSSPGLSLQTRRGESWVERVWAVEMCVGAVVVVREMVWWAGETVVETCPSPVQLVAALEGLWAGGS